MRYNRLYKDSHFLTPTTYTQQLSQYTANLKFEDLPAEVVERAKMNSAPDRRCFLAGKKYSHHPKGI